MSNLEQIYCDVDDFMKLFLPEYNKTLLKQQKKRRIRASQLSESEVMTILILFHQSNYRTFKHFYLREVFQHLRAAFPNLVTYSRFVRLQQSVLIPLCAYLQARRAQSTGIQFIDSTSLKVCHNKRINRNKVFEYTARRGKSTMDWFFGFKLHLVINEGGEILNVRLTRGNCDDRNVLPSITKGLEGKLLADKGYISNKYLENLLKRGLYLITNVRSNMKNRLLSLWDKILLKKRFIIETVNDQLKNMQQIEHTRHRSMNNFMTNIIAGLLAYSHQAKKPSIHFTQKEKQLLNTASISMAT